MSNIGLSPYFKLEDIKPDDLKQDNYVDPYYYLRRPIEPERLKSIYQQAFIFDLLYKFAKEYLPEVNENLKNASNIENEKCTDTTIDSIKDKVIEYLFKHNIEVKDNEEKNNNRDVITESENIWNTEDINILRKNFSKIKEQNFNLNSKMLVLIEENRDLKDKLEKLKIETKHLPGEIKTFEKENERLYIRVLELENRFVSYNKEMENFDKTIDRMKNEEIELKNKLNETEREKLKLEFECNKLNLKLKSIKQELKNYFIEKCENYKYKYLKEIQHLKNELDELNSKFNSEKSEKEKCNKALDHLRIHFMNNFSTKETNNKIDESQIKTF